MRAENADYREFLKMKPEFPTKFDLVKFLKPWTNVLNFVFSIDQFTGYGNPYDGNNTVIQEKLKIELPIGREQNLGPWKYFAGVAIYCWEKIILKKCPNGPTIFVGKFWRHSIAKCGHSDINFFLKKGK